MVHPLAHLVPEIRAAIPSHWRVMLSYHEHYGYPLGDPHPDVGLALFEPVEGTKSIMQESWHSSNVSGVEAAVREWIGNRP